MLKKRGGKLEPYKATVDRLLSEGVWKAVVILGEIQAEGSTGGFTILYEYTQPKCALRSGKATMRLETKPDRQLQSDWGEVLTEISGQPEKRCAETFQIRKSAFY